MGKVLIVSSSYRKDSNSAALAATVAEGAKSNGHQVDFVDISHMEIRPCRGCDSCLKPKAKGCVVKDDMQNLYPLIREADILILASPIYWFTMGGQLKQFIDRCYSVAVPPEHVGPSPFAAKKIGAVFVYGDEDPLMSGCVNAVRAMEDICRYTGSGWLGALYGSAYGAGEIRGKKDLMEKALAYGLALT